MPLIPQTRFNDGISEDDRIAGANHYLYGENIDVITEPDIIQLSKGPTLENTTTDDVTNMVEVNDRVSNGKEVILFSDGKIYHSGSYTPVLTDATMGQLEYPCFVLGDYLYWVENNGPTSNFTIDRISLAGAMDTTWSSHTIGYKTLSADNYFQYFSHLVVENRAYIVLGNIITILNDDGTTFEFNAIDDEIVGVANTFSGVFVFTETGNAFLWTGGENQTIKSSLKLNIKPSAVYQYGTQIFLLGGGQSSRKGLYQFDGSKAIPLYKEKYSSQAGINKLSPNGGVQHITNNADNFYFIDRKEGDDRILFYGNGVSGTNRGMHYLNTTNSNGDVIGNCNCILVSDDRLYVSWTTTGSHGVDKIGGSTRNKSGFIITSLRDYDVGIVRKDNLGVYFRVRDIDADHTIEFQASYDGGSYTSIKTINSMPKDGIVRLDKRQFVTAGLTGDFEDISFKLIFTSDDNTSPKVFKGISHNIEVTNII